MGSSDHHIENMVHNEKLSSVVPAKVTGEDKVHALSDMDLAMKLHYLRGIYFFTRDAAGGLDNLGLKKPMFHLLERYYPVAGRIRRDENGRPVIKCNDSGVRIVEAKCEKTVEEWLATSRNRWSPADDNLVYGQPLGPDHGFSPLVFMQFTWFKCGGFSVGLSWAHVLGDAFSASSFINVWGQILTGQLPPHPLDLSNNGKLHCPPPSPGRLFSLKRMEPVGDQWVVTTNNHTMGTLSFHLTAKHLNNLLSQTTKYPPFEAICAVIWKSMAKIRGKSEPRVVTICRSNSSSKGSEILSNSQAVSTVKVDFTVAEADLEELMKLVTEKAVDESHVIRESMKNEGQNSDFVIYGANLTIVNLESINMYDLELKGHKPIFANYNIEGVGEEGVVLVLLGPENEKKEDKDARILNVTLPTDELTKLKNELQKEWMI